jgi:hypothetical protein
MLMPGLSRRPRLRRVGHKVALQHAHLSPLPWFQLSRTRQHLEGELGEVAEETDKRLLQKDE